MTLFEALAELGIDDDAGPEEARRAYLRLVRTRKPETDPEGFMRLREAYDLVKQHLAARAEAPQGFSGLSFVVEQMRAERSAPAPAPEPVSEAKQEPEVEAKQEQEPEAKQEPEAEAKQEPEAARADDNDDPRADPLSNDVDDAAQRPTSEDDGSGADEGADVETLIFLERYEDAANVLLTGFDRAASSHVDPPKDPEGTLRFILLLHREGHAAEAIALTESFVRWLKASGMEMRVMRGDLAARFTLVRELSSLPETFPRGIRKALAKALLAHDPLAETDFLIQVRNSDRGRAKRAVPMLRAHAPTLSGMFGMLLDPPVDVPPPPTFSQPVYNPPPGPDYSRAFWAIPVILLAVLRVCAASSRSTPSYDYSKLNYNPPKLTDYSSLFPDGGARTRSAQRTLADIYVDMALLHVGSNSRTENLLRKLKREIAADDCDSARGTMAQIQVMAGEAPGKLGEDIPPLAAAMRMYCGPGPIGAGPSDAGAGGDGGKAKDAGVAKGRAPLKAPAIAPKPKPVPPPPKEDE